MLKLLLSSITHGWAAPYTSSSMVLLQYIKPSSIPVGSPCTLSSPCSTSRMCAPQSTPPPRLGASQFHFRLGVPLTICHCSVNIACSAGYVCIHSRGGFYDLNGSYELIGSSQFHSALLHYYQNSPCPPCTSPQPLFLFLVAHLLLSQIHLIAFQSRFWFTLGEFEFKLFKYYKSSQWSLGKNFNESPGPNDAEIQVASAASFRNWWIVYSSICQAWWNRRFGEWHWNYVRWISFQLRSRDIVSVLPAFIFNSLAISLGSPQCSDANNSMLMRCWVL